VALIGWAFKFFRPLFRFVIGSWQPPGWLRLAGTLLGRIARWLQQRLLLVLALALVAGAGWLARPELMKQWHGIIPDKDQPIASSVNVTPPKPARPDVTVLPPSPARPDTTDGTFEKPHPLRIDFSASAAPVDLVGKEATGVTIDPPLDGKWSWAGARRLEFQPVQEWPVGQHYSVHFGDGALAPQVELKTRRYGFVSPAFTASITEGTFYQDPVQANLRRAVFQLSFSHPVQPAELEKRLALNYDKACADSIFKPGGCGGEKFSVSYDKWRVNATVQSEPLPIPDKTRSMVLSLAAGLTAEKGGLAYGRDETRAIDIPGLANMTVKSADATIVTGENGEPEHVLQLAASMPVHEREMARSVHAWLLPVTRDAKDGKDEKFDWSSDPAAITDAVLKRASKVNLQAIAGEREVGDMTSFRMPNAQGGRYLLVRVSAGMRSPGGYQLGQPYERVALLKNFAPEIKIMSRGSLLALPGEKKLPVLVRDVPGIQVEIGRLLPRQLQHLITQSSGDFAHPEFYRGIQPDDLMDRFEKQIPISAKPGKAHYETIDFANYLSSDAGDRRGVFLLRVHGFDPEKAKKQARSAAAPAASEEESEQEGSGEGESEGESEGDSSSSNPESRKDQRLVLVTDLGLVVKNSLDGTRDVFVQSIASGQAVGDAMVEVWGRNGTVIAAQATDATGIAHLPSLAGFQREKMPVVLVARKGGDMSFIPYSRSDRFLDTSRFDVGGLRASGVPNQMTAYLFSDRGIYRPGDTMHIALLVKAAQWSTSLRDLPLEAEIVDPRGLSVRRDKLRLGPGGVAEVEHTTQDSSPTGNYTVNLYLPRQSASGNPEVEGLLLGSVTVKVQEFLPDRTKVALQLSSQAAEGWVSPRDMKALVDVQNLFGTPAQGRKVEGTLTLRPAFPVFRAFADYNFFDPQRAREAQTDELGSVQTGTDGKAEFDLRLNRFETATYQVSVLAKAFEPEGGRSVSAEARTLVSDMPYLIGTRVDGDTGYIAKDAVRQATLIAIDPQVKKIAVDGLKLVHQEQKVLSVLVKQDSGLYRYESRRKDIVLDEKPLAIAAAGNTLKFATGTPGNFSYVIKNAQDVELGRISYSVAGNANVTRSLDRNAELQLALDRKDYAPGDTIQISIRAPYTGAGLITIERDKVYAHAWFKTSKTASVQTITVPRDFEGTGYVNVHFVRDPASDEVYMSPLSYGIVPFATSLSRRSANLTLSSPGLVKPGETVNIKLASDKPTRAVVYAVDEGILQVARYKTPDPLAHFFQKRALEVGTLQTLDLILPEFKKLMASAAPGGDGEGELGKHLNPFKRKRDKPVAYWSGLVDINGSREFSYTVPESFNGSLRVMAVAVSDDAAGVRSASTTVRGDMVILPNAPLAMAPGDTVEVGVGLANNIAGSGKQVPIALNLAASGGLEVVGQASQTLAIDERGEASTVFKVRAKDGGNVVLGSAPLVFTATHGKFSARLTNEISVRPASPYVTLVQTGVLQRSGEIRSQASMYPEFARSEAAVSVAPWAFATGMMRYLEAYPHGCTEQITSQTWPAVLLTARPELVKEMTRGRTPEQGPLPEARQTFARYLVQLRPRQTADGGFAMWPGGPSDPFATLYATTLLVEAREHKLTVPQDLLDKANSYLVNWLGSGDGGGYIDTWRQRTQAAYLLTRQGTVAPAALANLRETWRGNQSGKSAALWREDLGAAYLAAAYQLVKQEQTANELMEPAWAALMERNAKNERRNVWGYYYDPLVHESLLLGLVARHFPARLKSLPSGTWSRIGAMVQDGWYNSLSSAAVLRAVDAYFDAAAQNVAGKFDASAIDAQGQASALAMGSPNPIARAQVPLATRSIKLSNGGDFPLYYSWSEQGFERTPAAQAVSNGLEIFHEVLDAKGQSATRVRLGEEVTVRVRVRSLGRESIESVALVDMLPGGLEPVLQAASDASEEGEQAAAPIWKKRLGGAGSWAVDYADIREDRVIFYGNVTKDLLEITYKASATNIGDFVAPPAYGEAMYDRRVFARSASGRLEVVKEQ